MLRTGILTILSSALFAQIPMSWNYTGGRLPQFQGGRLISVEADNATVVALTATGQVSVLKKLEIPETVMLHIASIASGRNGELIVACAGRSNDGRVAAFLALLDSSGSAADSGRR